MVGKIIACPPGLQALNTAVMGGVNPAVGAGTPYSNLSPTPQMSERTPGPILLGRASRGALARALDDKACSQGQRRKMLDRQRLMSDPVIGKSESNEVAQNQRLLSELVPQQGAPTTTPISSSGMSTPLQSAAPLRLADALGLGAPAPSTCAPGLKNPMSAGSVLSDAASTTTRGDEEDDVDAFIFGFTIRVAGGTELGLATSVPLDPQSGKQALYLRIDSVLPGGAVDAWNRQCGSSGAPEKVLLAGDKIIRVNTAGDTSAMLSEFQNCRLLRMLIVRTQH